MCLSDFNLSHLSAVYFADTKEDAASIGSDDILIYEEIDMVSQAEQCRSIISCRKKSLKPFRCRQGSRVKSLTDNQFLRREHTGLAEKLIRSLSGILN